MSNIQKTPDFNSSSMNYYITPVKKKKMDFNSELNYKSMENQEENNLNNSTNQNLNFYSINNFNNPDNNINENININNDIITNTNNNNTYFNSNQNLNFSETKNLEMLKRSENELMSSAFKRYFSSPYSNFLKQSPASFQSYMNCYSRENINVLHLLKKKHYGNPETKQTEDSQNIGLNALNNEFECNLVNEVYEKESECGKYKTPFKINANLKGDNKFISPKSNDKSNK